MSTNGFLTETLTAVAEGRLTVANATAQILTEYPRIDDHAGQNGYWNASDEHGNISGPYDSYEQAMDDAPGGSWPYWVDADEDEDEDI